MINQNYVFRVFVTTNKPVIIKTFNFKFKNESSFTKLKKKTLLMRHVTNIKKKILVIRHVTNKVIINLK